MPLRTAVSDARLLAALLTLAEREALALGDEKPAAEHLLLAAVQVPDASGLESLGFGADDVRDAITSVHASSLAAVGVTAPDSLDAPAPAPRIYDSAVSAQELVQRARVLAKRAPSGLRSAHVVLAALERDRGTVARVLDRLGVDREAAARRARDGLSA